MKTKLPNKFLLGLLLTIHNVGFGQGRDDKQSPDGGSSAVQNHTVRTLDDLRAELKKKNSADNMGGEGMSSGMSGMAMPSGPGMGGPAGGLGMGGAGMGSAGMGAGGLGAPGMGAGPGGMGPGMSGGMSGPGGMYGGMGSEGGYDGMGGSGAASERQLLAQMIQKLSQRLQSKKYKRETVEKQLRNALAQYFNADMEERLQEFDKVKAKVSELETKLQKRLERESEIIDLQLKQMLHKADGLDFSIPAGLDSGAMEGAMGGFGSGMGDGYGSEGSSGSMAGMPGMSGGYSGGMDGGYGEAGSAPATGYDVSFGMTRLQRLDHTELESTDPLKSYSASAPSAAPSDQATDSDSEKMKVILQAFHQFHERFHHFPRSENHIIKMNPPHSWRVAILPLIGHGELFDQYRFDQAWDSEENLKVAQKMPSVYRSARGKEGTTPFVMMVGGRAIDYGNSPADFSKITDGTSNTILIIKSDREVSWTKPEDFNYSPNTALPGLSKERLVGRADGTVIILPKIQDSDFRALITRDGGEPVSISAQPQ